MFDNNDDEEAARYTTYKPKVDAPPDYSNVPVPGSPNFRPTPWSPSYDPGPNWNNGVAPPGGGQWNPDTNQWEGGAQKQATADENTNMVTPKPVTPTPLASFQPPAPQPSGPPPSEMPAPPPASYKTPPITDEVTKILMARLNELKNPGNVEGDPIYQNAVKAYQVAALRGADRERKALAERTAAGGTRATGGFNVGVQGINERAGEKNAQYRSGLALDRLQAREQQLVQAIQMARAIGQDDIANQLEIQRLNLQQELGRGDLALRGELGRGQLGLGYDNLGFNYADLVTRANRDATLAALGGGS